MEINPESRHKIGDIVVLNFHSCGQLNGGIIAGIKYTDYGKVLYDISLRPFSEEQPFFINGEQMDEHNFSTLLKDVDSFFVNTEYDKILSQ